MKVGRREGTGKREKGKDNMGERMKDHCTGLVVCQRYNRTEQRGEPEDKVVVFFFFFFFPRCFRTSTWWLLKGIKTNSLLFGSFILSPSKPLWNFAILWCQPCCFCRNQHAATQTCGVQIHVCCYYVHVARKRVNRRGWKANNSIFFSNLMENCIWKTFHITHGPFAVHFIIFENDIFPLRLPIVLMHNQINYWKKHLASLKLKINVTHNQHCQWGSVRRLEDGLHSDVKTNYECNS